MSKIYVLNYNNYGNRLVKRESSLANYLAADPDYRVYSDINFYRGDGVNTTQTVNFPVGSTEKDGDYLIVTNTVNNVESIVSRWFIIECNYNRKQQLIFTLRRDLIVDFITDIKDQPFFAEKGVLPWATGLRSIICQPEFGMMFNQVLTKKTNIVSGTANGIYGYIDRSYSGNAIAKDVNTVYVSSLDELGIADLINKPLIQRNTSEDPLFFWTIDFTTSQNTLSSGIEHEEQVGISTSTSIRDADLTNIYSNFGCNDTKANVSAHAHTAVNSIAYQIYNDAITQKEFLDYNAIAPYINRHIMIGNDLYKLTDTVGTYKFYSYQMSAGTFSALIGAAQSNGITYKGDRLPVSGTGLSLDIGSGACYYKIQGRTHTLALTAAAATDSFTLQSVSARTHCGKPYDIFYMDWSTTAQQIASTISSRLFSSGALFDIQRLPYRATNAIKGTSQIITLDSSHSATLYWLNIDEMSLTSTSTETEWGTDAYSSTINAKIGACCDMLRIVSPNRANSWDMNPAQNGGVAGWYIRCTFKPFQPYIHIRPYFNGLYNGSGTNDVVYSNDPRGLICGGSFSMPLVTDKWANYQINNSAYYNSFDRDIENLSTVQDIQRTMEKWQIAAGTVSAATVGAIAGSNMAGMGGGIAGGIAAGTGSLIAGIADYEMNEKLRNEALDYKRDQFGFNSRNLIAAPKAIARTDAFDIDWNGFPYVEYYTATAAEKEMLKRKLKFNGMTLNVLSDPAGSTYVVGGLKTLLNNANGSSVSEYVKGKLIRFGGKDDTHVFNEICNELYKGIYWQGGTLT